MAAAIAEAWKTLEAAITAYTGLSPAAFFTTVALAAVLYYAVAACFAAPPPPRRREVDFPTGEPLQPPVQIGEVTEEELRQYDGSDPKKPLLMAIKGQIYDVSQSRMFYGPGGPYALFAGKDASRALAKMSFEEKDLTGDISGLGPFELDALQDWEYKFMGKYAKVGTIKKPAAPVDGDSTSNAAEATLASTVSDSAEPREVGELDAANLSGPTKPREAGDQEEDGANPAEPRDVGDHKDAANAAGPTKPREAGDQEEEDANPAEPRDVGDHKDAANPAEPSEVHDDTTREPKEADVLKSRHAPEPESSESKSEATEY